MNFVRKQTILSLLLFSILTACAPSIAALPTGTQRPSLTVTPTLTVLTQTPTAAPADNPSIQLSMFDEKNGWGIAGDPSARHILRTNDGGLNWKDVTPVGSGPFNDSSPFFLDAQHAWVISNAADPKKISIYRTNNAGEIWTQYQNLPFKKTLDAVSFVDPNFGWGLADVNVGAGNVYFKLYQTSDGGKSWQNLKFGDPRGGDPEKGLPAGTFHVMNGQGFEFRNRNVIWFGGNALVAEKSITILVSHNAGRGWDKRRINLPSSEKIIFNMVTYGLPSFITEKDGYILASYSSCTDENGASCDVTAVILTHDSGKTWVISPTLLHGLRNQVHLQFVSTSDAFVNCGENLCITYDGAQTWQPIKSNIRFLNTEEDKDAVFLIDFDFVNTTTGWASVEKDSIEELLKTTDGGQTWVKLIPNIMP